MSLFQEHTGSALFILYKAIMVQVEKGPLDYITGCAKYTLSEAKLFTAMDAEINAKTLVCLFLCFDYLVEFEFMFAALLLCIS